MIAIPINRMPMEQLALFSTPESDGPAVGTILIPHETWGAPQYCYRVQKASRFPADGTEPWPAKWLHLSVTRLDWDGERVGGHPDPLFVAYVYRAAVGLWRLMTPACSSSIAYLTELH